MSKLKNDKPGYLALHDSATGMFLALANFHRGESFEGIGGIPTSKIYSKLVNALPTGIRQKLYTLGAEYSAYSYKRIKHIRANEIKKWICSSYPKKKYPAIAVGSCNGALVHFATAMGIPWLPQTFLIPVHKGKSFPLNKPRETMEWGKKVGAAFLENNKDWQLHHMMDPVQDRLRVKKIAYFRIKCQSLGSIYSEFINENLAPGGKILIYDCNLSWPVLEVDGSHFFQVGGLGALSPADYYKDGTEGELNNLLEGWSPLRSTNTAPEAEWGTTKSFLDSINNFSEKNKIEAVKISFDHPQDIAGPVADVFQKWYVQNGVHPEKLLLESFNIIAPLKTIQKRCIPYWMFFNVHTAKSRFEVFIENRPRLREAFIMALSHGKKSTGYITAQEWKELLQQFEKGEMIGTKLEKYPVDLGVYSRYSRDLDKAIPENYPLLPPLKVPEAIELLKEAGQGTLRII